MTCSIDNCLGAYVLGALDPDEADTVRAHVSDCQACREEVSSLADTAALLALLTIDDIDEFGDVEPGTAAPVSARRRRRRVAVALSALVLVAAAALGGMRVLGGDSPPPRGVVSVVDPTTHVHAAVTMSARNWGTQLHLALTGAYPGGWCSLVAHSRNGRSDTAATWVADPAGTATVDGRTAIPVNQLSELDVVTATGALLVRINLSNQSK